MLFDILEPYLGNYVHEKLGVVHKQITKLYIVMKEFAFRRCSGVLCELYAPNLIKTNQIFHFTNFQFTGIYVRFELGHCID